MTLLFFMFLRIKRATKGPIPLCRSLKFRIITPANAILVKVLLNCYQTVTDNALFSSHNAQVGKCIYFSHFSCNSSYPHLSPLNPHYYAISLPFTPYHGLLRFSPFPCQLTFSFLKKHHDAHT